MPPANWCVHVGVKSGRAGKNQQNCVPSTSITELECYARIKTQRGIHRSGPFAPPNGTSNNAVLKLISEARLQKKEMLLAPHGLQRIETDCQVVPVLT